MTKFAYLSLQFFLIQTSKSRLPKEMRQCLHLPLRICTLYPFFLPQCPHLETRLAMDMFVTREDLLISDCKAHGTTEMESPQKNIYYLCSFITSDSTDLRTLF